MTEQLQQPELEAIRSLREGEELTFQQIAERLDVDTSTAHRILTKPGYEFNELTLIRIRKALARMAEDGARRQRRQKATA